MAAGHSKSTLAQAASAHPEVTVIDRSRGTATWSIVPGEQGAYVPASAWVTRYLDNLPEGTTVVDQAHFRAAAIAAGYDHSTARTVLHKSDRIVSEPAVGNAVNNRIWRIVKDDDGERSA